VTRRLLKEGWRVRAITRNQTSKSSQALADAGAELDSANYDDVESLKAAFKDAQAVFAVTNTFDYILEFGQDGAAEREYTQMMKIAEAAGSTSTLEHLVLHTLPSGKKMAGIYVPHMDVSRVAGSLETVGQADFLLYRPKTAPQTTSSRNSRMWQRRRRSCGSACSRRTSGASR